MTSGCHKFGKPTHTSTRIVNATNKYSSWAATCPDGGGPNVVAYKGDVAGILCFP
jgi:hypothetical protein